jgi:hypothetical protein
MKVIGAEGPGPTAIVSSGARSASVAVAARFS